MTDYMKYVGKRNSKAIEEIGKKIFGEGRNKKDYYYATLKAGYIFSCTSENLPINERAEIRVENFVKFKEMLRSICLWEDSDKQEKKQAKATKRFEKKIEKLIQEEDSFKAPKSRLRITKKDKEGLAKNEEVGIITGKFGTEKVIFIGPEEVIDLSDDDEN